MRHGASGCIFRSEQALVELHRGIVKRKTRAARTTSRRRQGLDERAREGEGT